jgi:hypothetical protein
MRDPDLVLRAQRAASALERAWERWRVMHGFGADPLPPVSSYVGYSLEEPWGQPRVVFGIGADEAERLAAILDGHDCVGPVHAEVSGRPEWRQQSAQEWRPQPNGPDAGPGWPLPGTALHVPAQQSQPDAERNGQPNGRSQQEPLADLPPFPEEEPPFAEEPSFAAEREPRASEREPSEAGLSEAGLSEAQRDQAQFAAEFAAAPVPADVEDDGVLTAKPARGSQARTRQPAKPAGSSPGKAGSRPARPGSADKASDAGEAEAPPRRKSSRTSPLQMPKRVRARRSAAPADDAAADDEALSAGDFE